MPRRELWLLDDARIMGGGQLFALRLARYVLRRRGPGALRIVCPSDSELGRRAHAEGIPVTDLAFPGPAAFPAVAATGWRLRQALRGADALVVAGSARCQVAAVAAGASDRLVHLMHERDSAGRAIMRFVHHRWGRVVAVGAGTAEVYRSAELCNFLLDEDYDRFAALAPPPGNATLGVLARLIPEKGVLELLRELDEVAGWSRLLHGGGEQDPEYAAAVRNAATERVQLLGHVDDVPGFLAQVDAVIVPSVGNEAQPTSIIEALAAGRPVIVREQVYSAQDYRGLPVFAYGDLGAALEAALAAPPPEPAVLRRRFGAEQALAAIEARADDRHQ